MGEPATRGTFSWTDLGTTDAAGAKTFYGGLFGWEFEDMPVPDAPYTMARLGGKAVGALYERSADQPPDRRRRGSPTSRSRTPTRREPRRRAGGDGDLGAVRRHGGGRMAVLQDPTGAVFAIWQPGQSIGAELVNDPGAITMNQLNTGDPEAASGFYSELFGWRSISCPRRSRPTPTWRGSSTGGSSTASA